MFTEYLYRPGTMQVAKKTVVALTSVARLVGPSSWAPSS